GVPAGLDGFCIGNLAAHCSCGNAPRSPEARGVSFLSGSAPARMPPTMPSPPPVRRGCDDYWWRCDVDTGGRWDRLCIDGTATQEQGAQGEPDDASHDITFSRLVRTPRWLDASRASIHSLSERSAGTGAARR